MRDAIELSYGQAMTSNMAILSPQAPFRCTIPQMTAGCQKKIIKEFQVAYRSICLAKARSPDEERKRFKNGALFHGDYQSHDQLLKRKWADLFFPSTVINETLYFLVCEFSTRAEVPEAQTRHAKVVGFIESRIKNLLQALQLQIGQLGWEDGVMTAAEGILVIVPESPFASGPLTSTFVIALPCFKIGQAIQEAVSQAFISFDLRMADYLEIGGWENHSSTYRISSVNDLPAVVQESYAKSFLGTPTFHDKFKLSTQPRTGQPDSQQPAMSLYDQF